MGKGKIKGEGLFKLVFIVVILVLGVLGSILFLTVSPIHTSITEVSGVEIAKSSTRFEAFKFVFGGEAVTYNTVLIGMEGYYELTMDLKFDYFALIALVFGVVGIVLSILLYKNKYGMLGASISALVAAIIGACEGLTFCFVNEFPVGDIFQVESIERSYATILSVGGILFAICFGAICLFTLYRFIKLSKNK